MTPLNSKRLNCAFNHDKIIFTTNSDHILRGAGSNEFSVEVIWTSQDFQERFHIKIWTLLHGIFVARKKLILITSIMDWGSDSAVQINEA